jgi:DNA polymerase
MTGACPMHETLHIGDNILHPGAAWDVGLHVLHRDCELRSQVILKTVGTYKYAIDPGTEILCCAFAVDGDPVQLWRPGDAVPQEFIEAANNPNWVVAAHNDQFEAAIEQYILGPQYGWPLVPLDRHRCTLAMALAAGLPGRLSTLADVLETSNRKDRSGERIMHQTSKPRRPHKDEDPNGVFWFDDQSRLRRLYTYCQQDLETEREIFNRLLPLSPQEQALWKLSCEINNRGFRVDREFAEAARRVAEAAGPEIDAELAELTDNIITGINQVARMLVWLGEHNCSLTRLDRKSIEKHLAKTKDIEPKVQRVLELRLGGAQASTKKIASLLNRAGQDDRIRGAFRFHGASTGRWAAEGFQPQNLKKPIADLDAAIAAVRSGNYQHVKTLFPKPLATVGDTIRSMIVATPKHVLIGADFSSIESRVLAWVAGEQWKIDAYHRYDTSHDPKDEPYCATACKIFRVPDGSYTKESPERSAGKTCDLAFGYMGGLNAWRKFEPERFSDEEVEQFKTEWRTAHPAIKRFWYDINRAALTAVHERGRAIRCGPVAFRCSGALLQLKLPSGRKISYPQPRAIGDEHRQHITFSDNGAGQFSECRAYGGLWTENIVSGIARDLLAEAMIRVEAAGYPIVLHVHDELVCEIPDGFGSAEEFTRLMTCMPAWAPDLPIAASAWTAQRYCK